MGSEFKKIYTGNPYITQRIVTKLQEMGVEPVVKDESESAHLAGFAANVDGAREIHVNEEEYEGAALVVERVLSEISE